MTETSGTTTTAGPVARVDVGEVELAFETFGESDNPPLLLVMGLATQMLGWPDGFCAALADAGFHVVRFDNRDIGLSTHLETAGAPDLATLLAGGDATAPYTVEDMAEDTVGLLDALGIGRVHLVGASMGGMIAQSVAIRRPDRLRSLTSIMSTPSREVGHATQEAQAALLIPPATTVEEATRRSVAVYRTIGSPGYGIDEAAVAARARAAFERNHDAAGVARQLAAIAVSPDRTPGLRALTLPTLVIHGEDDPLVHVDGGRATAAAIPGARLVVVPGMGHDLPEAAWPLFVEEIATLARSADTGRP